MILCIDIGNSLIHMGVFQDQELILQFRHTSKGEITSDQFGVFLKNVLTEHGVSWQKIGHITICSVVPELDYSIRSASIKYFNKEPFFLAVGAKTGLKINYTTPGDVGADRIASAIGASWLYPQKNIIIVDMGTATTVCAITEDKRYLGGAIFTGVKTSAQALYASAAKLPTVEIVKPKEGLGRTTKENVQIGVFYGQLGAIREMVSYLAGEAFSGKPYIVVGTGGFSELYREENLFHQTIPELTLRGLERLHMMNKSVAGT